MRIAILSRKGIEKVINETLQDLPINKRFEKFDGQSYETVPCKVQIIPAHSSYSQEIGETSRIIDLIGPYEDVPNFVVAANEEERKRILKKSDAYTGWYAQNQLIVLDKGVFFRNLEFLKLDGYNIRIRNVEGIHFSNGYCISENKQKRQLQGTEIGFGAQIIDSDGTYIYGIGSPKIWGHIVEDMTNYFLSHDLWTVDSNKVLFSSERSRDKVIEIFDKLSLTSVK